MSASSTMYPIQEWKNVDIYEKVGYVSKRGPGEPGDCGRQRTDEAEKHPIRRDLWTDQAGL